MRSALLSVVLGVSLCAIGCADEVDLNDAPQPVTCGPGVTRSFLVSTLGFTRVDAETQTVPGFNLDALSSDGSDEASCYKKDYVSPEGEVGIDNQLAGLIPEVEKLFGNAVDSLMQGAINNGDLLIAMDVQGAGDMENDDCVDLSVRSVLGRPTLGTDGVIEAYQTYDTDPSAEISRATGGKIEDGVLTIGPFELAIPIAIFDVAFTVHVHDAHIRARVNAEDGQIKEGLIGGGVVPQEILDGVAPGAGVAEFIPILSVVLNGARDLAPDEDLSCQQVSATLKLTSVEAFVREP